MATDMQLPQRDRSQPENLLFIARLRALMDSYAGDRMTVGEIGDEPPLPRQQEYTAAAGPPAHGLQLLPAVGRRGRRRRCSARRWSPGQDDAGWPSWSLGNHDVTRFPTRMAHRRSRAAPRRCWRR